MNTLVDDTIHARKDTNSFYGSLLKYEFKFHVLGNPAYHLGGYFKKFRELESILKWGSQTYVKIMMV